MPRIPTFAALLGATLAVLFSSSPLRAEPLTLDRVLALARTRGPDVALARLRIEETRGRVAGALPLFAENPGLSGGLGRRYHGGGTGSELEGHVELVQPVELGGARAARVHAAEAAVRSEAARADAVALESEAHAAAAFYRALAAGEHAKVAQTAETVAVQSAQALERRHQLGDVPVLEVNVARMAQARAFARVRGAATFKLQAEADLRLLLGLAPSADVDVTGDLRDRRRYRRADLLARAKDVPGVRALLAELDEANADGALARARRWPKVGFGAAFERDDGANVFLGLVTLEIPVFAYGQELRATSEARARRVAIAAEAGRAAAIMAVHTAWNIYEERQRAVDALTAALPFADENEELARKSYDAGQLSLADLLVVRQQAFATRVEYIDELLATAEAGIVVATSAGVSP